MFKRAQKPTSQKRYKICKDDVSSHLRGKKVLRLTQNVYLFQFPNSMSHCKYKKNTLCHLLSYSFKLRG